MASQPQTHQASTLQAHLSRSRASPASSRSSHRPLYDLCSSPAASKDTRRFHNVARRAAPPTDRVRAPGISIPSLDISSVTVSDTSLDIDALETRDVNATSYVSRQRMKQDGFDANAVDEEGLPLVYNEELIANFWKDRPGELASRWTRFAGIALPWLTSLANSYLRGSLKKDEAQLARKAVDNLEKLGPTFIKLGQILSIRPDVLPPSVMKELSKLQDKIAPFSTEEARAMVEEDLGAPIDEIFSSFSEKPIAAASLAQVYRATLVSTGQEVAVKVQRPSALSTISKDLYVMRRGVGVYESIVKRFTAQTTDYQRLVSTFAEGLYTEMDFRNEALNMLSMKSKLEEFKHSDTLDNLIIPSPLMHLTSRRVMTMEWVTGVKLTELPSQQIRDLVKIGQEAFLVQLLEIGFFHGDPHPGNLLLVTEGPDAGKLALLDFGLVAEIPEHDREAMVSATIHLANKDWSALIDDFVALGFLPQGCDRGLIIPVMDRVLSPYLRGGGAAAFNFQALSQDLLAATLEIPFSVPPYMSLLARSVATLEGIALTGDPSYQMVAQAYPFVVRKVLRNETQSLAAVLRDILFSSDGSLQPTRLSTLLNAALGYVADAQGGFIDFDAVPDDGASMADISSFLLSEDARELRPILIEEVSAGLDLFLRDRLRKAYVLSMANLQPRLPLIGALPTPPPPPVFVPGKGMMSADQFVDSFFPKLTDEQEVVLDTQVKLAGAIFGVDTASLESLDATTIRGLLFNPSSQLQELQTTLVGVFNSSADAAVVREVATSVAQNVANRLAARGGVPVDQLFPMLPSMLRAARSESAARPPQAPAQTQARSGPPSTPSNGGNATTTNNNSNDANSAGLDGASGPPSGGASSSTNSSSGAAYSNPSVRVTPDVRGRSRGQDGGNTNNGAGGSTRSGSGNTGTSKGSSSTSSSRSMSTSSNGISGGASGENSTNTGVSAEEQGPFDEQLGVMNGVVYNGAAVGADGDGDGEVPAPVVEIVGETDLKLSRRTDGIRMIPLVKQKK